MSRISLLHTAESHVTNFDRLFGKLAPKAKVTHVVKEEWLEDARENGLHPKLTEQIAGHLLGEADKNDRVICTCTTLGPVAEAVHLAAPNIMRIDTPMMEMAAEILVGTSNANGIPLDKRCPTPVLVGICLESTRATTVDLLKRSFVKAGVERSYDVVLVENVWPLFEAGSIDQFNKTVARAIRRQFVQLTVAGRDPCCVVLGQASMAGATRHLDDLGIPILSSPFLAAKAAVDGVKKAA